MREFIQCIVCQIWFIIVNLFYLRDEKGKVRGLMTRHVDTGMGLERMATILQEVPSNYDTDLFLPIIKAIKKARIN